MQTNTLFLLLVFWIFIGIFFWNILFDFHFIVFFLGFCFGVLLVLQLFIKKHIFHLLIFAFWIAFGGIYAGTHNYLVGQKEAFIAQFYDKNVVVVAEVQQLYKKWENFFSYIVDIDTLNGQEVWDINVLVYYPSNYLLHTGDKITFEEKLLEVKNFSPWFNYKRFLQIRNIYAQFFVSRWEILSQNPPNWFSKIIWDTRQFILDSVYSSYPKDEAVFLAGILIWAREDMGETLSNNFSNAWLTHLVAVSGFNITIIIIFLWFLFQHFPLFIKSTLILITVVFFVLLVWDNIPVIRAGIMGLIGYFILVSGRKWDSLTLLMFTAFVLVMFKPFSLNYDASFHLSFLAVIGLLYFQQFWEKVFFFLPKFFAIKESFVLTMSAMTTTLPVMVFNFGKITFFAPITNMLVWWVIPFAMLFWFLWIIWNAISSTLWYYIGYGEYFLLKYVVEIAHFFWWSSYSIYEIDIGIYSVYAEILYFMILFFIIVYTKNLTSKSEIKQLNQEISS